MQDRFTLRFQDGERQGDTVPITSPRFTLGRRPGNSLQIQDGSVSGQHAEFIIDDQGALLKDLGSTNGTRLGGEKIESARPAHGDILSFGSINAVFEDAEIGGMPISARAGAESSATAAPAPKALAASASDAGDGVERVSAEMIARSGKGSKVGLIVGLVLLLGGGGAAAYFMTGGGPSGGRKFAPVVEITGNKLRGGSFEGDGVPSNWSSNDAAPALFGQRGDARASGKEGMRASLIGGEWAWLASDPIGVSSGRELLMTAMLRARGDVSGRVGIEFLGAENADGSSPPSHFAWGAWLTDVSNHQAVELTAVVPVDSSRARLVVEARAAAGGEDLNGMVDVDDVSLVDGATGAAATAMLADYGLWLRGNPASSAQLSKINRSLIGELRGSGAAALRDYPLTASASGGGFDLTASGADQVHLRVESAALEGGLATIGESGLAERGADFEADGVTSVLMGSGHDLVALVFEQPVSLSSRANGSSAQLRIQHNGQPFHLQVDFREERSRAGDLAYAARQAEKDGHLGECLAGWNEMLASVPYDDKLVTEAREARTRLEQAGLVELAAVEEVYEQAQFFRLVDLFRQCRENAQSVGAKYAGSAVETQAAELVQNIDQSLAGLEQDLSRDEVQRLTSILKVLEATDSPRLANEVRSYMSEEFGEGN